MRPSMGIVGLMSDLVRLGCVAMVYTILQLY
eukprot:SAG31_NODE_2905_length_4925_cov_85.303357_4_plen_31_part_00